MNTNRQKTLIVIPTYNEAENIRRLIPVVLMATANLNIEILVVDDNSPDGTASIIKEMIKDEKRLHIMERQSKGGLASAYIDGFKWGMKSDYDNFLEMDADFSHNPECIVPMVEQISNYDMVIGSRNIKGGGTEGWPFVRNVISKGGSLYSQIILGCPIKDLTGGFNLWRKETLEKINLDAIISTGYSFQIEMKYKAYKAGCSYLEYPIIFKERAVGTSKMSKKIFFGALINVLLLRFPNFDIFAKFALTGGLGTITNLAVFFVLADLNRMPAAIASSVCYVIAATQNYLINHVWSFKKRTKNIKPSLLKWAQFLLVSLVGLSANLTVLTIILHFFELHYKFVAQGIGIFFGMIVNYIFTKMVVFKAMPSA
jgi:dolichol-phosphate mannosyltransferase